MKKMGFTSRTRNHYCHMVPIFGLTGVLHHSKSYTGVQIHITQALKLFYVSIYSPFSPFYHMHLFNINAHSLFHNVMYSLFSCHLRGTYMSIFYRLVDRINYIHISVHDDCACACAQSPYHFLAWTLHVLMCQDTAWYLPMNR